MTLTTGVDVVARVLAEPATVRFAEAGEIADATRSAARRYAKSLLAMDYWSVHCREDYPDPSGEAERLGFDKSLAALTYRSSELTNCVVALEHQVAVAAWAVDPKNPVLIAANIQRGRDELLAPLGVESFESRAVLFWNLDKAAKELETAYETYLPVLAISPLARHRRACAVFLIEEARNRRLEAAGLIKAEMTIAGQDQDERDGLPAQGTARDLMKHRWIHDDGTKWRGAHRLVEFCRVVVDIMAVEFINNLIDERWGEPVPRRVEQTRRAATHSAAAGVSGLRRVRAVTADDGVEPIPSLGGRGLVPTHNWQSPKWCADKPNGAQLHWAEVASNSNSNSGIGQQISFGS